MTTANESDSGHQLKRQMRLRDLVLAQILTVVGSSWVGIAAGVGSAQFLVWLLPFAAFYTSMAVAVYFLNREMPLEGGLPDERNHRRDAGARQRGSPRGVAVVCAIGVLTILFILGLNAYPFMGAVRPGRFAAKVIGTTLLVNAVGWTFYRSHRRAAAARVCSSTGQRGAHEARLVIEIQHSYTMCLAPGHSAGAVASSDWRLYSRCST